MNKDAIDSLRLTLVNKQELAIKRLQQGFVDNNCITLLFAALNKNIDNMDNTKEDKDIYMVITSTWRVTMNNILIHINNLGDDIINDCTTLCKDNKRIIINCWNVFQAAVAAKYLGYDKKAEFFIKYVNKQLNLINKTTNHDNKK